MIKPKPCPFCGGKIIDVVEGTSHKWRVAQCMECGSCGPEVRIMTAGSATTKESEWLAKNDAYDEWNMRT